MKEKAWCPKGLREPGGGILDINVPESWIASGVADECAYRVLPQVGTDRDILTSAVRDAQCHVPIG
jgi:hypothetical protein